MKKTVLFYLLLSLSFTYCSKNNVNLDIQTISLNFSEQLREENKPVCLRFNISSEQQFINEYLFEEQVYINENSIDINIGKIKNNGKYTWPLSSSIPPPDNPDSLKCPARGSFILDNLQRENYKFNIKIQGQQFIGNLKLSDQLAIINFIDESKVIIYNDSINIVPDSCIFGTYSFLNINNNGFDNLVTELKNTHCNEIFLNPGKYRAFEIDVNGKLILNSGQAQNNEITFIYKHNMNIDEIVSVINNYVNSVPEAYGIIMHDSNGDYYNIKKPPSKY